MSTTTTQQLSYWSNLNALWEFSGLPQQKFCEQEGVKYKQFVYWRERISAKHSCKRPESKPRLLSVAKITYFEACMFNSSRIFAWIISMAIRFSPPRGTIKSAKRLDGSIN